MTRPGTVMSWRRREFLATSVAGRRGKIELIPVLKSHPVPKAPSESALGLIQYLEENEQRRALKIHRKTLNWKH